MERAVWIAVNQFAGEVTAQARSVGALVVEQQVARNLVAELRIVGDLIEYLGAGWLTGLEY
jgi:hypothetical protein